jgi:uncharacterized cysteine cluster protein YcgN (CxxCxxCC family)
MFRAAFLPIIGSISYIGFGTFYAVVMNRLLPGVGWLPETCRVVIPINLEFNASVGSIHKESVTMHGHTIIKNNNIVYTTHFISGAKSYMFRHQI